LQKRLSNVYESNLTSASLSAMLELGLTLKYYKESMVLVGGWVPYFLIEEFGEREFSHVGSIDIDFAINPDKIDADEYATIVDMIKRRGYNNRIARDGSVIQFSFIKNIKSPYDNREYDIQVDFLTSPTKSHKSHRHRKVQHDLPARIAKGCDLAFSHNMNKKIDGILPDNGESKTEIKILDIPGCIGMKGVVLGEGYREKDAYDLYTVIGHCLESPTAVAKKVRPYLDEPSMNEGINSIQEKFRNINAEGPSWTASFMFPTEKEMQDKIKAESYILIQEFLEGLN